MYIRGTHAEPDLRVLRRLIQENPLGMLTTAIKSPAHPFLQTSHVPFVLDVDDPSSATERGRLRGHMARANPQAKAAADSLAADPSLAGVLEHEVVFTRPEHHYVTPKFYVETKPETGKVVPTWNYAAVQAYGRARFYVDGKADETGAYLDKQIRDLTRHNETETMGYTGKDGNPDGWTVEQAPANYIELLKKAIVGVEIEIDRLEGKFKMSQEMGEGDREGVIAGMAAVGTDASRAVSDMVRERHEAAKAAKASKASKAAAAASS